MSIFDTINQTLTDTADSIATSIGVFNTARLEVKHALPQAQQTIQPPAVPVVAPASTTGFMSGGVSQSMMVALAVGAVAAVYFLKRRG